MLQVLRPQLSWPMLPVFKKSMLKWTGPLVSGTSIKTYKQV